MASSVRSHVSRDRFSNILTQLRGASGATIVCVGLYDTESRGFDDFTAGDGASAEQVARLRKTLHHMLSTGRTGSGASQGDGGDFAWMTSGRVLLALGKKRGTHRALAALIYDEAAAAERPDRRLVKLGMLYVARLMDDVLVEYARRHENFAEKVVDNLAVNALVVDPSGSVAYRSGHAEAWLSDNCAMDIVQDRLVVRCGKLKSDLRAAVEAAASPERKTSMLQVDRDGEGEIGAVVMPLSVEPPRALVVFAEDGGGASPELLLGACGLTRSEQRVALCLLTGMSIQEAAVQLGIKESTARSYLKEVFSKTGIRKQSQLISFYHAMMPPVRVDPSCGGDAASESDAAPRRSLSVAAG